MTCRVRSVLAFVTVLSAAVVAHGSDASQKIVSAFEGHSYDLWLPFEDGAAFEEALMLLGRHAGVSVGLERVRDSKLPGQGRIASRNRVRTNLTGQELTQAMQTVLLAAPALRTGSGSEIQQFALTRVNEDVVNVRPTSLVQTFLDTTVPSFNVTNVSLTDGVIALHRLFDKEYPDHTPASLIISTGRTDASSLEGPISVSVRTARVRDILNDLVRAKSASWVATYITSSGSYEGSQLTITSSTGYHRTLAARR